MTYKDFLLHCPDVQLTSAQESYCRYLESRGLRFGVDYGYENAEQKAWSALEDEDAREGWLQ